MNDDNFEKKLSKLFLANPSDSYFKKAQEKLLPSKNKSVWSKRLNYTLGLCLMISFGFNLIQLSYPQSEARALSANCQINSLGNSWPEEYSATIAVRNIQPDNSLGGQILLNYKPQYC